jgi:hypothetical protein
MSPNDQRPRPWIEGAGSTGEELNNTLTPLDDIARHIDGSFVVVVETRGSKFRRRCFLTAKAAEAAAGRATARGESATVYLAALQPLWKLRGGDAR